MITTGMKLMLGGVVVTADRRVDVRLPAWRDARHHRADLRVRLALSLLAGVTIATRDANVSSMDPTAATESPAARPAAAGEPVAARRGARRRARGRRARHLSGGVHLRHHRSLLATIVEWMIEAWSERASADADVQRRDPRADRQPGRVPGAGGAGRSSSSSTPSAGSCCGCRSRADRCCSPALAAARARRRLPVRLPAATRPSRWCAASARSRWSPSSPVASPRRIAGERRHPSPRRPRRRSPTRGGAPRPTRPRPTTTRRRSVAAKANITAEIIAERRRHAHGAAARAAPRRARRPARRSPARAQTNVLFRNESATPATARARHGHPPGRGDGDSTAARCRTRCAPRWPTRAARSSCRSASASPRRAPRRPTSFFVPGVEGQSIAVVVP